MISTLLLVALMGTNVMAKGTWAYFYTQVECKNNLLPDGTRNNTNYNQYSVQADIKNDACWPNEIRADPSKRGERRRSVLIPKQDGRAENIGCLWRYNSNDAHCETEPEYTMQYELKPSTDTCYTFDTGTMSHDYGSASYWFTQGHCPEGYKRQSIEGVAFDSDTGLKIDE